MTCWEDRAVDEIGILSQMVLRVMVLRNRDGARFFLLSVYDH